jgi:hypothetical protein
LLDAEFTLALMFAFESSKPMIDWDHWVFKVVTHHKTFTGFSKLARKEPSGTEL